MIDHRGLTRCDFCYCAIDDSSAWEVCGFHSSAPRKEVEYLVCNKCENFHSVHTKKNKWLSDSIFPNADDALLIKSCLEIIFYYTTTSSSALQVVVDDEETSSCDGAAEDLHGFILQSAEDDGSESVEDDNRRL